MDLKHFKIFFLFVLAIFLTIGLTISFQSLLAAWTAPSANPPNNNTDAPLNAGNTVQSKQGSLWINTAGAFDPGLWVTGNVGIGVSNPSAKLEVFGTTKITGTFGNEMLEPNLFAPTFQQNDNNQFVAAFKIAPLYNQTSSSQINNTDLLINRTEFALGPSPGKQFLIDAQVGGVSKFVVDNKGKVGIGTDSPAARLTVSDSVAPFSPPNPNTESELDVGGFHFGDTVQYRYYSYKDVGGARVYSSTYATGGVITIVELGGGPGSRVFLNWEASPDLVDGYRILRNFTPNVGIDEGQGFIEYAETTGNSFTDSNQGQFQSGSNAASSLVTLANYNTGTDFFGLYTNSKAFFDNNVGIGTTLPGYKLDVQGAGTGGQINASAGLCIAGDCKTAWSQAAGANYWTAGGNNIYSNNTGNVGIGTANPGTRLELNGVMKAGGNYYNVFSHNLNGTPANGIKIKTNIPYTSSTQMPTIIIEGYNYGSGSTMGISIVWYIYNGNFTNYGASSWGNTAPVIKLANEGGLVTIHLAWTPYYGRFGVRAYAQGMSEQASWFNGWTVADEAAGATNQVTVAYSNTFPGTVNFAGGIWNSSGNVGIGTVNPGAKLEVAGAVKITGAGILNSAGHELVQTNATDWTRWNQGQGAANGNAMYQSLALGTGGLTVGAWENQPAGVLKVMQNAYLAVSGGKVGIGTANPPKKLTISGGHVGSEIMLYSIGDGGANDAVLNLWASEPNATYTGVGISNNIRNYNGSTAFVRENLTRGGSYIRLLDTAIAFNTVTNAGTDTNNMYMVTGNVGIGTANPGEKLEVNGAIKFGADASVISKAPRVIHTEDPVAGCPPARPADTDLFAQTFTLTRTASVYINASLIRNHSGRADLYLYVDGGGVGAQKDQTLGYTPSLQWLDNNVHWAGTLAAGNHTVSLRGNIANIWGCGGSWGSIDTIIFE